MGDELILRGPTGAPFRSFEEVQRALGEAEARADTEKARADALAEELTALRRKLGEAPESLD